MKDFVLIIVGIVVAIIIIAVIVGRWFVERPIKIYENEESE